MPRKESEKKKNATPILDKLLAKQKQIFPQHNNMYFETRVKMIFSGKTLELFKLKVGTR